MHLLQPYENNLCSFILCVWVLSIEDIGYFSQKGDERFYLRVIDIMLNFTDFCKSWIRIWSDIFAPRYPSLELASLSSSEQECILVWFQRIFMAVPDTEPLVRWQAFENKHQAYMGYLRNFWHKNDLLPVTGLQYWCLVSYCKL